MNGYFDRIRSSISRLADEPGGGKIVCAVSGGPDSVAMLLMLRETVPAGFEVVVAHFDHNIREESDRDARWVEELAESLGLPFYGSGDDVPLRSDILRLNLEEAARDARRDYFRRLARDIGAIRVALGHIADDQATTVLMNLTRGAGARGLGGMVEDDGLFWRPVLAYSKSELIDYLNSRDQDYLIDSSNDDLSLTRNRVEKVVLPELREINPGALGNMLAASEIIREQDEYIDELIEREYGDKIDTIGDFVVIKEAFTLPTVLLKPLLNRGFNLLDRSRVLLASNYAAVYKLGDKESANLPGRITAQRKGFSLILRPVLLPALASWRAEVAVPGKTGIPDIDIEVNATEEIAPADLPDQKAKTAWFRKEAIGDFFVVRNRRPGDVFLPSGGIGKKRLKDFFIDEKVPVNERDTIPIIEASGRVIWVVGYRIANGVSAEPGDNSISICVA